MARIGWRTFDRGLWLAGGRDNLPDGALRRATGVSQLREGAIRSARGQRILNLFGANQYIRFDEALFQSTGPDVLREGIVINAAFPQSGLLGQVAGTRRASFLRAPPQADLTDYLFVAGGNNPFKVKADGTSASKWGIDPPPEGFGATADAIESKSIDTCDVAATWTRVGAVGVNPSDEPTIAIGGVTSMRFDFEQAAVTRYTKAVTTNLEHFGSGLTGLPSADQDYIEIWFRITSSTTGPTSGNEPSPQNFDYLEISFALGAANFDDNVYTRRVEAQDGSLPQAGLADQKIGLGGIRDDEPFNIATDAGIVAEEGVFDPGSDTRLLLNTLGQSIIYRQVDVWQRVRVSKSTFDRTGGDATLTWADVQAVRLSFSRSGECSVLVDNIALAGGYGLVGNYQYAVTYRNDTTGSRSNPNETDGLFTPVKVKQIDRGRVIVGNLPISADPQVDKKEIWRTVGNGEAFFLLTEIDNAETTFIDEVADFRGLFTGVGYLTDDQLPDVLGSDELQFDNAPPPSTILEVLGMPHLGRAWWLDSAPGQEGRVFFSPAGRPESNAGFVDLTNTDEPLVTIARWNDVLYVFSRNGLFRIVGDDEPFTGQEVFGSPGTSEADTVVVTPFGIFYRAADGIRLFDGQFSTIVSADALGPVFRGYTVDETLPFEGITAAYIREDYYISDGQAQILIYNARTQTWRFLQLNSQTLYAADDDEEIIANIGFGFVAGETTALEDPAADEQVTFEIEVPTRRVSTDTQGVVQRIFIDIETGGAQVTPRLLFDDTVIVLPVIVAAARTTIEYARLNLARLVAVRLSAVVTTETIIVYGIEADVYVPAGSGAEAA
jgi:hypothetical protein